MSSRRFTAYSPPAVLHKTCNYVLRPIHLAERVCPVQQQQQQQQQQPFPVKVLAQQLLSSRKKIALCCCSSSTSSISSSSNDQQELVAAPTLVPPSSHHQPQLSGKQRAALRAQSETLAKEKSLQRLQVGAQGITHNVLMACMDILVKHEFLRVKLGEGCGLERKTTAALLGQLLDAAVVGQIGFTITLYRQKGLPRPDNLSKQPI